MNGNYFAQLKGKKRNLLALVASSAMLTAGCANMATTASSGLNSMATGATVGGKIHGGNQPVSNAIVTLYFAAQSIYGAPTPGAQTRSSTDGTGSFNFIKNPVDGQSGSGNEFSCPAGDPLVYVVAKGGNTLNNGDPNVHNDSAAFIAIFPHTCDQLTSADFVNMSELTTVATMAAAQQFFDPSNDGLSADGTGQQYNVFINLPNTIALLADVTTGTAVTSTTIPASTANGNNGVTGVSVTATPEEAKLNTLANILSSCINNANNGADACTTLFSNATPPNPSVTNKPGGTTFAPPSDTLQAIYYILTNPTNGSSGNLSNIFGLSPALGAPYGPTLATAPSDWTLAINYSSSNTCGNGGGFISSPYDINIDYQDNVWIANSQTGGNLSQLSLNGAATTCVFLGGGASHGGATIDLAGNVWMASTDSPSSIYRYSSGVAPGGLPQGILAIPTAITPLGVTADGLGNVYYSGIGGLYQIPSASSPTPGAPVQISSLVGNSPIRLMPDNQGSTTQSNIWVTSGDTFVSEVSPAASGTGYLNGFITTQFTTGTNSYGLAVTNNNNVYVSDSNSFVTLLTGSGTTYTTAWTTPSNFAGMDTPTGISLDGVNNVWIPNHMNISAAEGSASEISAGGAALSPAGTGYEKDASLLFFGRSSVVDQAGNVWVVGDNASGSLTEIVGAGVPVYQPYSVGLSNGRFQTIP